MNLVELLQMTKAPQTQAQQPEGLGPIMQFLSANSHAPQLPQMQLPIEAPGADAIMSAAMQKKAQKDNYAAHLQAKNDMELQQAQAISGHEGELSDNPQVQAMLKSGNPQLVAYAMKIAEDEQQKKIAARYDEKISYSDWLQADPQARASMSEFMKLNHPGTSVNIDTADKFIRPTDMPNITDAEGNAVRIPAGTKFGDPTMQGVYMGQPRTTDEKQAGVFFEGLQNGLANLKKTLPSLNLTPGVNKEYLASIAANSGVPVLKDFGQANQSENRQMYDQARHQVRQEAIHLISQGAFTDPELEEVTAVVAPDWGDKGDVPLTKLDSLERIIAAASQRAGHNAKVINPILAQAAERLGVPQNHPIMPLAGAIANQESGGKANIHDSVDGAQGIMQVMPGTFRQMNPNGNIRNPVDNAQAGLSYLLQNWQDTGGDMQATAMRYHGGPKGDSRPNVKDGLGVSNARYGKEVVSRIRAQSPDGKAEAAKKEARIKELRAQAGLR